MSFLFFILSFCGLTSTFELVANGKFLCNNTLWLQKENRIKHYHEIFEDKKKGEMECMKAFFFLAPLLVWSKMNVKIDG